MLKDQRNCALTVSTLSVGLGEGVGTCSASSARVQFRVCLKAFELYNCPKTFVMIVDIHTTTSVECRAAVKEGVGGSLSVSLGFFVL